jgi:hypothetical protein
VLIPRTRADVVGDSSGSLRSRDMEKMSNKILQELEGLAALHKGIVRPIDVVEYARNEKTALHGCFDWDDGSAADKYRLYQARQILRVTVTVLPRSEKKYRAFVSLSPDRGEKGGGYRLTAKVLSDKDRRGQLLADALSEMTAFKVKYSVLEELAGVFAAMDKVIYHGGRKGKAS